MATNLRRIPHADILAAVFFWGAAILVSAVFLVMMGHVVLKGAGALSWQFLVTAPSNAGRSGGVAPILVSTFLIVGTSLLTALPLALGTSIYLAEFSSQHGRFGMLVRRSLDVLAGVPSIVFGLFGNVFFCKILGLGFSILSGGLTLACMILPLMIRTTEESLRAVPEPVRLGAAALGVSRASAVIHLLIPIALPGLAVGVILGLGRAAAETAALIFTSGYVDRMPGSVLDSGRALTVHIYDLAMNVPGGDGNAYGSALLLVGCLLIINLAVALLTRKWQLERTL